MFRIFGRPKYLWNCKLPWLRSPKSNIEQAFHGFVQWTQKNSSSFHFIQLKMRYGFLISSFGNSSLSNRFREWWFAGDIRVAQFRGSQNGGREIFLFSIALSSVSIYIYPSVRLVSLKSKRSQTTFYLPHRQIYRFSIEPAENHWPIPFPYCLVKEYEGNYTSDSDTVHVTMTIEGSYLSFRCGGRNDIKYCWLHSWHDSWR